MIVATKDPYTARLDAAERLLKLFLLERIVYISATVASLLVLFIVVAISLLRQKAEPSAVLIMFGSTGAVTITAGRVLSMFNRVMGAVWPTPTKGGKDGSGKD